MRSKIRASLLALLAVSAFGALASSASRALPEFGNFGQDKGITFKGTIGRSVFKQVGGTYWEYEHQGTITGEITGEKTVGNVTLTFKESSNAKSLQQHGKQ